MKYPFYYNIFFAALLIGCFFLYSCENDPNEVKNIGKKIVGVEEASYVKINYSMGGLPKAILTAPLMLHVDDSISYYEFPKTVYAEFFNLQQIKESKLTANYAKYKDAQSIVYLKDSVKIINMLKGDTIYCEDLYWDKSRIGTEFYTSKKVQIRQKDGQFLNGVGLEADQAFKNFHLLNGNGVLNTGKDGLPK